MKPGPKADTNPDRFWARVDKSGDCWLWTGATSAGYGRLSWDSRLTSPHRLAYVLTHGPIPAGMFVMHACDRPACCNPAHLSIGTNSDNMRDAASKGRGPWPARRILTDAQVREVRATSETLPSLARRWGVGESTVRHIRNGDTYRDVAGRPR